MSQWPLGLRPSSPGPLPGSSEGCRLPREAISQPGAWFQSSRVGAAIFLSSFLPKTLASVGGGREVCPDAFVASDLRVESRGDGWGSSRARKFNPLPRIQTFSRGSPSYVARTSSVFIEWRWHYKSYPSPSCSLGAGGRGEAWGTNPNPNHKSNPNQTIEIPPPCVPQSKQ